jgi:hypothetical protein
MGSSTRTTSQADPAWAAAESLAARVTAGGDLPILPSAVALSSDEVLHGELVAGGWRFHAADVVVEQRRLVAVGGLFTFGIAAAANSIGNRRAWAEAERIAAPQWRPLGAMPLLATNQRLLAFHEGQWASVWYSAICRIVPSVEDSRLELIFEDDPPYLLVGEWVPYLTVIITAVLAQHHGIERFATMLRL